MNGKQEGFPFNATLMRGIRIILQIFILFIFNYLGGFIVEFTGIPLPGSIIGLLLLVLCLQMKWLKVEIIRDGASFLIAFLTLFFIPSTVGIIEYPQLWSVEGLIFMSVVIVSTLFTISITSIISQKVEQRELSFKEEKMKGEGVVENGHIHR